MKYFVCTLLLACATHAFSQSPGRLQADEVMKLLQARLGRAERISYQYRREMQYFADNYKNANEGRMYIEFDVKQPAGFRFTAGSRGRSSVYNGHAMFRMDEIAMTIDSMAAPTAQSIESNSDVFYSLAALKNILPLIIGNDTLQKSVSDTAVNGITYTCVYFEAANTYLSGTGKFQAFTSEGLRRPYYLLIDKSSGMPFQFSTKFIRPGDDRDFITVTYSDINLNPPKRESSTWEYETYASVYKRFVPAKKIALVKPGDVVSDFLLPAYTPKAVENISLHRYSGKIVLLDFWFKSCGPCMEAMPKYNALQDRFGPKGFNLLTVNVEDGVEDIKFFYNKYKPGYPMMFNGNKVFAGLGFTACPSSVLIDRNGKVVQVFMGYNEEKINTAIAALLQQ